MTGHHWRMDSALSWAGNNWQWLVTFGLLGAIWWRVVLLRAELFLHRQEHHAKSEAPTLRRVGT